MELASRNPSWKSFRLKRPVEPTVEVSGSKTLQFYGLTSREVVRVPALAGGFKRDNNNNNNNKTRSGSAGGPDGVRPQHILEMVNCRETGPELHPALAGFVNCLLQGEIHPQVSPVFLAGT